MDLDDRDNLPYTLGDEDEDNEWEAMEVGDREPLRDLTSILHPIGNACRELRTIMIQVLQIHICRWIYKLLSSNRSGLKWRTAVRVYWNEIMDCLCELCMRKLFAEKWHRFSIPDTRAEVTDIIENIMEEDCVWSSLLYDTDFAHIVRIRVMSYEPTQMTKLAPCTSRLKSRSNTKAGPGKQLCNISNNLNSDTKPQPFFFYGSPPAYTRQNAVDERYSIFSTSHDFIRACIFTPILTLKTRLFINSNLISK